MMFVELQVHHEEIKHMEAELDGHRLYEYFRSFYKGYEKEWNTQLNLHLGNHKSGPQLATFHKDLHLNLCFFFMRPAMTLEIGGARWSWPAWQAGSSCNRRFLPAYRRRCV